MADYHYAMPHRKAVPAHHAVPWAGADGHTTQQPPGAGHAHSRTMSSQILPVAKPNSTQPSNYTQAVNHSRRTMSSATASSSASSAGAPGRQPSTVSINLRRSTSSRSGQSVAPTSYVALMRKQKATVWCDRSQHEDPRLMAQAKAAKMRATVEVLGGRNRLSTSTSMTNNSMGMRSKIRHHGAPKAAAYSPATLLAGTSGVPMRLSASEVDGEEEPGPEEEDDGQRKQLYTRSGSGRSSLASGHRLSVYPRPHARLSQGSTPPSGQGNSPAEPASSPDKLPGDYFQHPAGNGGSGSSGERENSFGNVGDMTAPAAIALEAKPEHDLNRRGSVDERAMTMRGPRLFVANPDLSD